ncbi:PREDICTED: mesothelin [Elephantulus edwardii]|uniref:mesothelin n=1 Tax=Elephantulus edwardii TaxID=28737 RepID=UPI0003F0EC90|nr:PREDICTED: mesothelin [Elephantulus edwardii]
MTAPYLSLADLILAACPPVARVMASQSELCVHSSRHGLFSFCSLGWMLLFGILAAETQGVLVVQPRRLSKTSSLEHVKILPSRNQPPEVDKVDKNGCPTRKKVHKVTEELVLYSDAHLEACLDGTLLARDLGAVDKIPFTNEQLSIFKRKLDKIYPKGYPENIIQKLGTLFVFMSPNDIRKWKITSLATLKHLLSVKRARNAQVTALIKNFVATKEKIDPETLDLAANLNPAYLCVFSPGQLQHLKPSVLQEVHPQDLAKCSQSHMEVLFSKARIAFKKLKGARYFGKIRPYLRGVTTKILREFIEKNEIIDVPTYKALRPETVKPLTSDEVRKLLGPNIDELMKELQNADESSEQRSQQASAGFEQIDIPNGVVIMDLGTKLG